MSRVIYKSGNLLDATEDYIVHQCNCITKRSLGLSEQISERFPYANPYSYRRGNNMAILEDRDVPGTIKVYGNGKEQRYVIGMFAQYNPGKPQRSDTSVEREDWFLQCLHKIGMQKFQSVAFPDHIGCGLAGGDWEHYHTMIREISVEYPETKWVIYKI